MSVQTLDNERAKVAELEAQVASDQAAISSAATELSYTRIVSPLSGRAGLRLVDQGNIVHAGDAGGLVVINQIDPISVISTLPEQSLPAVAEAMRAGALQAQALSREDGRVLATGTVSLIDNQIDPNSGTVKLKSDFPNARDALWPGQFVDIKVRVDVLPHAVTIPASALQRGPQGLFVFAVGPDDRAQTVPVSAGQIADGTAVIETGLAPGQRVITGGQYRVRPGSLVTVSVSGEQANECEQREARLLVRLVHPPSDRHLPAHGGPSGAGPCGVFSNCPWHRCRTWTSPRFRSRRSFPARARKSSPPRSPSRWNGSSARFPAWRR